MITIIISRDNMGPVCWRYLAIVTTNDGGKMRGGGLLDSDGLLSAQLDVEILYGLPRGRWTTAPDGISRAVWEWDASADDTCAYVAV